ncbi:MAG: RNA polymerase sigma factor [Gemmatimonadetes bacterium]|nr:RNA polymerase sigma factor [Gemmatimonadota bacterium]
MTVPAFTLHPRVTAPNPDLSDDRDLALRAQAGDLRSFEVLFGRHVGRTFALCLRMTGDRQRARELAHDAFVRAWERLGSYKGEAAFSTWLHRLTVNVILEAARSQRRREARVALADDTDDDVQLAAELTPTDVGDRIDLERAIAKLPPNARQVFVLHDVEGFRHDEIADRMAIAPGTVRAHLHRARKLLMTWLDR